MRLFPLQAVECFSGHGHVLRPIMLTGIVPYPTLFFQPCFSDGHGKSDEHITTAPID